MNAVAQQLFPVVIVIAIVYLIILRPQQQQKRKHEEAILAIKKGDEIVTSGGLVGDVIYIKSVKTDGSPSLDDRLTIKSGESRVIVERGRIARVTTGASGQSTPAKSSTSSAAN